LAEIESQKHCISWFKSLVYCSFCGKTIDLSNISKEMGGIYYCLRKLNQEQSACHFFWKGQL